MTKLTKGIVTQTLSTSESEMEIDFSRPSFISIKNENISRQIKNKSMNSNLESACADHNDTEESSITDLRVNNSDVDMCEDCVGMQYQNQRILSDNRSNGGRTLTEKMNFRSSKIDISKQLQTQGFHEVNTGNVSKSEGIDRNASVNRGNRSNYKKIERLAKERESLKRKCCPFNEQISPDQKVSLDIEKAEQINAGKKELSKKKWKKRDNHSLAISPTQVYKSGKIILPFTQKKNGFRQQILVSTACSLAPLSCGFAMGFNLIINPFQIFPEHLIPWTWQQHIYLVGAFLGSLLSGCILNYGRRYPLLLSMLSLMFGWLAVIFGTKIWMILFFYGLSGVCTSIILVIAQVYVAEISQPTVRGGLSTAPIMAFHVGLLICFLFGDIISTQNLSLVGLGVMAPFFLFFVMCLPESPRHLARKHSTDTLAVLQWLRGFSPDVMEEFKGIVDSHASKRNYTNINYLNPSFLRPLMVTCLLMFLNNMAGATSVAFYGRKLLGKGSQTYFDASYFILTATVLLGVTFASFLVDKVGRKLLLLLSFTIMAATAFSLGLFLFLKDMHKVQSYFMYQWAAELFCVILFTLAHGSAVAPVAWITLGEAFSPQTKWLGVTISSAVFWLSMLVMDIVYHQISFIIATGGLFWFHCIICVGGYIFLLLTFRELKDHNIDEVSKVYAKKSVNLIDTFITRI